MKKPTTLTLLLALSILYGHLNAQHFQTVWSGNPYQPMSVFINTATIDNIACATGDEIAVFDVNGNGTEICVGKIVLAGEILAGSPAIIPASLDDPLTPDQDGFVTGNALIYRIWDASEATEIIAFNPTYNTSFDVVYTPLGTALVTLLEGFSAVETSASSISTCQGSIPVSINVSNMIDVEEFNLTLNYETTNLSYIEYQNSHAQLATGTLSVTENSGEIIVAWNGSAPVNISSGTLLEFVFIASTVYGQTTENLTWDGVNSYYQDSNGTNLQTVFNNGSITLEPIPVNAGTITGETTSCQGTLGHVYQVGVIANATSYTWELNPSNAGTMNGSGNSRTIDYSALFSGSATLSVYGSNSCGDGIASSLPLNIVANPTASAGVNALICEDANYTLSGSATNQQSVVWTSSGDGSFDNATLLSATYTPGANDKSSGMATLTLTAQANSPCSVAAVDFMTLTIQSLPTSNAGPDAIICENNPHTLSGSATNEQSTTWTTAGDDKVSITSSQSTSKTCLFSFSTVEPLIDSSFSQIHPLFYRNSQCVSG